MKLLFDFIPQGSKITKDGNFFICKDRFTNKKWDKTKVIILDTGNALEPGIVDHHQPDTGAMDNCVASIICTESDIYLKHLLGQDEVTIVTHYAPDLDALGSVYFTRKYLLGQEFTASDNLLSEYILEVDSGKLSIDPEYPISIASIWLAISNSETNKRPDEIDNEAMILKGVTFLDNVTTLLNNTPNPWSHNLLSDLKGFEKEKERIIADKEDYFIDLIDRSQTGTIKLYNIIEGGIDELDCILTKQPKSFLWKYWVRGDKESSTFKNGYPITCAHFESRSIISVDPNMPYNLKGLGLLIDRLEIDEIKKTTTDTEIINGQADPDTGETQGPRPGFHRNDPWYDGRGFHNYTIIDAPRAKSLLNSNTIESAFFATNCWSFYSDLLLKDLNGEEAYFELLKQPLPSSNKAIDFDQVLAEIKIVLDSLSTNNIPELKVKVKNLLCSSHISTKENNDYDTFFRNASELIIKSVCNLEGPTYENTITSFLKVFSEVLRPSDLYYILFNTRGLNPLGFSLIISKCEQAITKENLFLEVLTLQNLHPSAFLTENINFVETSLNSNGIDSSEIIDIIKLVSISINSTENNDELPIYGFNKLKNYIDDLLICNNFNNNDALKDFEDIQSYVANDFSSYFKTIENKEGLGDFIESFNNLKKNKINFLKTIFGSGFEKLLKSRTDQFEHFRNKGAKLLKKYSIIELIELSYFNLKDLIDNLNKEAEQGGYNEQWNESEFKSGLNLISEFAALEDLYSRSNVFYDLQLLIKDNSKFNLNPFILEFHVFIYELFRAVNLYSNSTSIEDFEQSVNAAIESLNKLRVHSSKYDILATEDLREDIFSFLPSILDELHLEIGEIDKQVENALSQYVLITKSDGILSKIDSLPYYYRVLLSDLFQSLKRYYRERIDFFRNDFGNILDLNYIDKEERSNDEFILFYNKLINESIKFDWQELKDHVDDSGDKELMKNFYDKYFNWLALNIHNKTDELSRLNSSIRFAEGESSASLAVLVDKLPIDNEIENYNNFIKDLSFGWKLENAITHFPVYLIHQSYDHILHTFISKFDVDNVKNSLSDFSTSFPWYYKWFTNKRIIQSFFIIFCSLLILAGIFDNTVYSIDGEDFMVPAAGYVNNILGDTIFQSISSFIGGFWGVFLSLAFILPIGYGLYTLFKSLIPSRSVKDKNPFKFIQLISSIEGKRAKLLYLSFILPLLLVVIQMASPDTIDMINNIEGIRLISTLIIIIGLTMLSVYLSVKEKNGNRSNKWILSKTQHMFWLHLLQAILLTVFVIDLLLRFQLSMEMFPSKDDLVVMGISKYIELDFGFFDFRIMPVFSILVAFLTLFFSFFIDKVIGGRGDE